MNLSMHHTNMAHYDRCAAPASGSIRRVEGSGPQASERGQLPRNLLRIPYLALALFIAPVLSASAQDPAITDAISINQAELVQGDVPLKKVLASGRHLFTTPFTTQDGYGEGPYGPRMRRGGLYPRRTHEFRFLRLNGLDSQSCFECHNSIGSEQLHDTSTEGALGRKPAATGGPAGFASTAFINPDFPEKLTKFIRNPPHVFGTGYAQQLANEITLDLLWTKYETLIKARLNPFQEQKGELRSRRIVQSNGELGELNFGTYRVTFRPRPRDEPSGQAAATESVEEDAADVALQTQSLMVALLGEGRDASSDTLRRMLGSRVSKDELDELQDYIRQHADEFHEDLSEVIGVSRDMVVRPFQWKGIASDERNFVRDAMNFHFSMQPVENFFEVDTSSQHPHIRINNPDQDRDGKTNEVSVGNVSALTIFTLSIRPPSMKPVDQLTEEEAHGRSLFLGEIDGVGFGADVACARCHVPAMRAISPVTEIRNPNDPEADDRLVGDMVGLSAPRASTVDLPVMSLFNQLQQAADRLRQQASQDRPQDATDAQAADPVQPLRQAFQNARQERAERLRSALSQTDEQNAAQLPSGAATRTPPEHRPFFLNLTTFASNAGGTPDVGMLRYMCPRLPERTDHSVDVPLFSDLTRHSMGVDLADVEAQQTDVHGITVPADQFLTRPLWGVADSGPWLHDGRALTLREAILLHQGPQGELQDGTVVRESEANPTVEAFKQLSSEDQQALVAFLLTLRLSNERDTSSDSCIGGGEEAQGEECNEAAR